MQVLITQQAQKQFLKITKSNQEKIKRGLNLLCDSPFTGKPLKGKLEGYYSFRCWPYRILYQFDSSREILYVLSIIHRQGAYT